MVGYLEDIDYVSLLRRGRANEMMEIWALKIGRDITWFQAQNKAGAPLSQGSGNGGSRPSRGEW